MAAGLVPLAQGSDGGGSIRIPAAVNGLVGLKPTRGRLAQDAMLRGQPVRIVSDGVVTRSVRDTAALFREAEKVYRPLKLPPIGDITRPGKQRLRVAVHTGGAGRSADADTVAATWRTATLLEELGHHVEEVPAPVPDSFPDDFLLYWATLAGALVASGSPHVLLLPAGPERAPLYKALLKATDRQPLPEALAKAQRALIAAGAPVEDWAGVVVVGG